MAVELRAIIEGEVGQNQTDLLEVKALVKPVPSGIVFKCRITD